VGVKAEVEKTKQRGLDLDQLELERQEKLASANAGVDDGGDGTRDEAGRTGDNDWVEIAIEIPGYRDDDSGTIFLAAMLSEALLADGAFTKKLWINRRFHWKLYLDVGYAARSLRLCSTQADMMR
jgi:exosome complex component RRP42